MSLIIVYIDPGVLLYVPTKATLVKRRYDLYTVIEGILYKRGLFNLVLGFLWKEEATYVLLEVHEGIVGHHLGVRTLAKKVLREEY